MTRRDLQSGTALILVLWLVAALSLVVLAGAHGVRQQTQRVGLDLDRLRSELILDAALQLSAQRLLSDRAGAARYRVQRLQLGSNTVLVEIVPTEGLIDVNVASEPLLQALFQRVGGLPPGDANILAARVRDFIDPDDIPSGAGGAEAAQYRAAGRTTLPRNSGLEDLSELKSVLGMTPELYDIIAPFATVNGQPSVSVIAAPSALIDALSGQRGLGQRLHQSTLDGAPAALPPGLPQDFFSPVQGGGGVIKARAFVQSGGERWWQREALIDLRERPDALTPWTTLSLEPTRRVNKPEQEFNR